MRIVKRLDTYILRNFLLLFAGSFFVCLFVFMMQFTWKFIDDLVGKGLTLDILARFYWYMALTLVPQSLPLAVLLASLITFGNMAENLELLSMKAAGVSLLRIMAPLFVTCLMFVGVSFYFQNNTSPHAQITLRTLLFSMRQSSPAVEIPEGVFYSGVPNVNLYVQRKDAETGMLYQVIIYKTDQGFDRAQIVLADSARMEMTADKLHLTLDLWDGEQFENLQGGSMANMAVIGSVPYDRETFQYKHIIIDFDSNFAMFDADLLRGMASAKSEQEILLCIDSLQQSVDSIGRAHFDQTLSLQLPMLQRGVQEKPKVGLDETKPTSTHAVPLDSLLARVPASQRTIANGQTGSQVRHMQMEYQWRKDESLGTLRMLRLHLIELHQKVTLSLACLLFFLIGAPLGAAIGKGGLGLSTVVSVLIFILYYVVNTSGMKMGRQGTIPVWVGMWMSTAIMVPCGIWLTYKSYRDKLNININAIWNKIKQFPLWQLLKKPSRISVWAVWSSLSTMKIAKTKVTLSWLPNWLRRKR